MSKTLPDEAIADLISAVRSINRGRAHQIKIEGDDEPCFWQRQEWVNWLLELADTAEKSASPAADGGVKGEPDHFVDANKMGRATEDSSAVEGTYQCEDWFCRPCTCDKPSTEKSSVAAMNDPKLPEWWDRFIQNISEIPDRTSPDDEPAAMIATADELESCALRAME
ncbi:MAG: hypothetical protein V4607_01855 [Pseudomonadota bacterium]